MILVQLILYLVIAVVLYYLVYILFLKPKTPSQPVTSNMAVYRNNGYPSNFYQSQANDNYGVY